MAQWSNIEVADLQVLTDEELREVAAFFSTRQEPLSQREADVLSETEIMIDRNEVDDYDESMDGDHESALASAGWGTDEDYGCYGGEDW